MHFKNLVIKIVDAARYHIGMPVGHHGMLFRPRGYQAIVLKVSLFAVATVVILPRQPTTRN